MDQKTDSTYKLVVPYIITLRHQLHLLLFYASSRSKRNGNKKPFRFCMLSLDVVASLMRVADQEAKLV